MTKVQSGQIPVWTVDPLVTRVNSLSTNANTGVDNPAFYDHEGGICAKKETYPTKHNPSNDGSYTKKQCNSRLVVLMVATVILLLVLLSMVIAVIYLAVGEVRTTWSEEKELEEIEEGLSLVEGQIRITNRVFTKDLLHSGNAVYHRLSLQIIESMDAVFINSLQHYNETRVLSYSVSEGSVIARCLIHFSKPRHDITHQVGMAIIQALERHHGYLPGGLLQVDIRSLQFIGLHNDNEIVTTEESTEGTSLPSVIITEANETLEPTDCGGNCEDGEVCLLLPQTPFSRCLVPRDANDPSGCGGWCVTEHQLCRRLGNATYQCTDNVASCKQGEWQCGNGLCIPVNGRCNGRIECYDMSDELDCECGADKFRCGNSTPCLPAEVHCNGRIDCWDASDEVNCTKSCSTDKFTCNDGTCVEMKLFCDRYPDCADGTDEPEGCNESCLSTQKQCHNGRCVNSSLWCNGQDECGDGSDEKTCDKLTSTEQPSTTAATTSAPISTTPSST